MMNKVLAKIYLTLALAVLGCMALAAQDADDTRTRVFDSNVKSVKLSVGGNKYVPAIYVMGSDRKIEVNFDYLDYARHYLRYSVVHCDADWQPSQLQETEYVDGFNYADITDYAQSEATFVHYFNYDFSLPNDDMKLTKSGNYLLKVWEQDDPEKVLFQTRFCVSENLVNVGASVSSRTDIDYNEKHQELAIEVANRNNVIKDPYGELTVVVMQNSREDNAVAVTKPQMVGGNKITFAHDKKLIFPAGNEFRRIETVALHSLNMGVVKMAYFDPYYHATLRTDQMRSDASYEYDKTQYGRFTVRNAEGRNSNVDADYFVTHFSLDTGGEPLNGGRLCIDGEFADGMSGSSRLMKWDETAQCYVCDLLLKQGAYNYQYLWYPDGASVGQTGKVEGDKYQTVNEYLIKIYDRPMGGRYDRLIGSAVVYSGE